MFGPGLQISDLVFTYLPMTFSLGSGIRAKSFYKYVGFNRWNRYTVAHNCSIITPACVIIAISHSYFSSHNNIVHFWVSVTLVHWHVVTIPPEFGRCRCCLSPYFNPNQYFTLISYSCASLCASQQVVSWPATCDFFFYTRFTPVPGVYMMVLTVWR